MQINPAVPLDPALLTGLTRSEVPLGCPSPSTLQGAALRGSVFVFVHVFLFLGCQAEHVTLGTMCTMPVSRIPTYPLFRMLFLVFLRVGFGRILKKWEYDHSDYGISFAICIL